MCAVYPDARNPFAFPELLADEGLDAWAVPEVWLMSTDNVNHYVDITETFETKLAALRAHVTQTGHRDELAEVLRDWFGGNARDAGLPDGHLAEAFRVVNVPI